MHLSYEQFAAECRGMTQRERLRHLYRHWYYALMTRAA